MLWPKPLSAAQLKQLEEHNYSMSGCSLFEPLCQVHWSWLVQQIPIWVAPNTLTSIGLVVNILTTVVLVCYCPSAKEEAPAWAFILSALGLFIYQSLDAIDGKQARRTNNDTPLEELFDHGCDAVSTVLIAVGTCISCGIGHYDPDWIFFCGFIGPFMCFCAHWQTYVSGTVRFGLVDVTEVQFGIMAMYLVSAFGGVALWQTTLHVIGMPLYVFPILGMVVYASYNNFHVILNGGMGKDGSTVADMTHALFPGVHIMLILMLAFIFKKSSSQLVELHPCLYIITFGMVISKMCNKLVVAHMTKSELYLPDTTFIGPGLLFLNQYFNSYFDEYIVLWMAMVFSLLDLMRYFTGVSLQISSHLKICTFSITPPGHAHRE